MDKSDRTARLSMLALDWTDLQPATVTFITFISRLDWLLTKPQWHKLFPELCQKIEKSTVS